ncbi:MaoC family dehydratase [Sphingobium sp. TA15]|uniref:MaoC-like dehydratase n=1 Tax=Sphingobium indicum (strain DSM 16413 / CCM 7287 / MTCC 6362 / UT26 / NBRC 101211 / UT26S) TaxID=452662 RepID=D4Z8F3_SPHIU|nr:MaoC family dehydratase [Sphingobium indicum]BAI98772.1 MaoC-like dehydratase [Sphingobium indicum UT26S]BDD68819.1 MaoC family dehydratase [Sphingobium sp. TA15]
MVARTIDYSELESFQGQEIGVSRWFEVTQRSIDLFAEATGDRQWVHVDVERATRENGGTIAHGFLTLALLPVMLADVLEITGINHALNYGLNKVRFTNPVRAGGNVRVRQKLLSTEPKAGGLLMISEMTIEIEGEDRPACVAEGMGLLFPGTGRLDTTAKAEGA